MYVHPAAWGVPYGRLTYFETCNKDRELAGPPRHGGTEPLGVGATTRRGDSLLADRGLDEACRGVGWGEACRGSPTAEEPARGALLAYIAGLVVQLGCSCRSRMLLFMFPGTHVADCFRLGCYTC